MVDNHVLSVREDLEAEHGLSMYIDKPGGASTGVKFLQKRTKWRDGFGWKKADEACGQGIK